MKIQVAMEYLITYGWAIAAVLIVLGVILSSGVFGSGNYGQEYCLGSGVVECVSIYSVKSNAGDVLILRLRNNFGNKIKVNTLYIETEDGNKINGNPISFEWKEGEEKKVEFTGNFLKTGTNRLKLIINYSPCDVSCSPSSYKITKIVYTVPQKG